MKEWTLNDIVLSLPKWPELVVVGEPVTIEQAAEILIRTDNFRFFSNDQEWETQVKEFFGIPEDCFSADTFQDAFLKEDEARKNYNVLSLNFLHNNWIMSSYVNGPHGWCDWAGNIETEGYNIGKWPDYSEVYEDWRLIAKAFPFLKLKSQLFSGEYCEEDIVPVVEFHVENGNVRIFEPGPRLQGTKPKVSREEEMKKWLAGDKNERGCTFDKLKWAAEIAKNI